MKEHQRTDRLTLITILFVIVIGVIMISYRAPKLSFELSPEEMLPLVQETEYIVPTTAVNDLVDDEKTVFIDIRNKGDFVVKHIKNAKNIPLPKILDEESMDMFEDEEKAFILYGCDHSDANGVWMLLRQLGFENIKIMLGGFKNFTTDSTSYPHFYNDYEELVQAELNLNEEIEARTLQIIESDAAKVKEAQSTSTVKKTSIKKPKIAAPALPPPPEEEEEEEEGC